MRNKLLGRTFRHAALGVIVLSTAWASPALADEGAAGYKKGFFVKSGEDFGLKINGRVQTRFTYEATADDDDAEDTTANDEMAFSIPRARLTLKGHAFDPKLTYKFQADFGKGLVNLKDFFVNYKIDSNLHVRFGQWKRPFSRQQLNSSSRLELVDRALTNKAFDANRDVGIALHNNYEKSPTFEWVVGVFNGTKVKPAISGSVAVDPATGEGSITKASMGNVPDQLSPTVVARVGYNDGGIKGYHEGDLKGGDLRYGVGMGVRADLDWLDDESSTVRANVDYSVKYKGIASTGGFYTGTAQDGAGLTDQTMTQTGYHVQLSYVVSDSFVPVVRLGKISPEGANNDTTEYVVGVSSYLFGHSAKWQSDFTALTSQAPGGDDPIDYVVRTQFQLSF